VNKDEKHTPTLRFNVQHNINGSLW